MHPYLPPILGQLARSSARTDRLRADLAALPIDALSLEALQQLRQVLQDAEDAEAQVRRLQREPWRIPGM